MGIRKIRVEDDPILRKVSRPVENFDDRLFQLLDDMKDKSSLSLTIPLKITLSSDYSDCWAYGSYTTTVNVSKK